MTSGVVRGGRKTSHQCQAEIHFQERGQKWGTIRKVECSRVPVMGRKQDIGIENL